MNRVVALLLIPTFMLGQAWPHAHAGLTKVDPDEHALRPHIHLSTADHHQHDHHHHSDHAHGHATGTHQHSDGARHEHHRGNEVANSDRDVARSFDHDSDAVYFAAGTSVASRTDFSADVDQTVVLCWSDPSFTPSARWRSPSEDPPERYVWSPIYLLTLSLLL